MTAAMGRLRARLTPHLDLLSARTDTDTNLEVGSWESGTTERSYHFRTMPLDARTADFTFAVHQGRWVEFKVKPKSGLHRIDF